MKVLMLLLLVVTTVRAEPRPSFCPQDSAIYPCTCTTEYIDERIHLNLDCSNVPSNSALESVFQEHFPITKFTNLTISPKTSHPALVSLNANVFGNVSFTHIRIENTYIRTISENALSPSHDTLISLALNDNRIEGFPFETLPTFNHLRIFSLSNNKLSALPNLQSSSLQILDLSRNVGIKPTDTTFIAASGLEEVYLNNMGFTDLPPNVFSTLNRIRIIDLSNNDLRGVLGQGVIRVPLDSLEDLDLSNNHITNIDRSAITGVHRTAVINFNKNNINALDWNDWYPLLDQLIGKQALMLNGNPLSCSCDIVWLLLDLDELDKIADSTTCYDGSYLKDTDVNDLLIMC